MKTRQRRKVRRTKKRGGEHFYPYNKNPILFTNLSNKQQGGTFIQNLFQRAAYGIQSSNDVSYGRYAQTYKNPDPLVQPISSLYKL